MSRNRAPRTVAVEVDAPATAAPRHIRMPWWLATVGGGVAVLFLAWVIVAAVCVVGWLTSSDADLGAALRLAASVVVLANGGTVVIGSQAVSIAPLGITSILVLLAIYLASFAARLDAAAAQAPGHRGPFMVNAERIALRVAGSFGAAYLGGVLALGAMLGAVTPSLALGALTIGTVSALFGATHGLNYDPTRGWPSWVRTVPRAMGSAVAVVIAGAALALTAALVASRDRVTDLVSALDPGTAGNILLTVLHLSYLPNIVLACASWVLGAGITFGDGTLLTVASNDIGLLPSIPVLGAIPNISGFMVLWLGVGALAGLVAGAVVALARPRARFDETSLVGGLSGVLAGLLIAVLCGVSVGGIGANRLAVIGARLPELFVFAPTIVGLGGLVGGLAVGLWRRYRQPVSPSDEPTTVLDPA